MDERARSFLVEGRSDGVNNHGTVKWSVSVHSLFMGRSSSDANPFRGRPALAGELLLAFGKLVEKPLSRQTFKDLLNNIYVFLKFLDEMEMVSEASNGNFLAPTTVLGIPGLIWALFKDWLDAQGNNNQYNRYYACKPVFDLAASICDSDSALKAGYPLPLNPYVNPRRAAARPADDDTLDPTTIRAAANALFKHVRATSARIGDARDYVNESDSIGEPLQLFHDLVT